MNRLFTLTISLALLTIGVNRSVAQGCEGGDNATLTVHQIWSQEPQGYNRTAFVRAPEACSSNNKFPVVFFLHGLGSQGNLALLTLRKLFNDTVVLVAPNGYNKCWNWNGTWPRINESNWLNESDMSEANDIDFLVDLIAKVGQTYPQADMDDVTLVGLANGGMMILRLLIEVPEPRPFHRVVLLAASLDEHMYHDGSFWTREGDPMVPVKTAPKYGYISFHGTNDTIVPYNGGRGVYINENIKFWSVQQATHIWTAHWGGPEEEEEEEMEHGMVKYSYLGGRVVHYKVFGAGHCLVCPQEDREQIEAMRAILKNAVLGRKLKVKTD